MSPPHPATSVAAMIRRPPALPDSKIHRDLLGGMKGTSAGYWLLLLTTMIFVSIFGAIWPPQVYKGLAIAGSTNNSVSGISCHAMVSSPTPPRG